MAEETIIGVIGGSGLYDIKGLENVESIELDTPFGPSSSAITAGVLSGAKLLFIARHGPGHTLLPAEVNYRANIYALKVLGAQWCLSLSAVGSLKEEFVPGHVAVPDQFIDRTKGRASTFFGDGVVAHVPFAHPYCPVLRAELFKAASKVANSRGVKAHDSGTYLCMEGPAFSTRAESFMYQSWGATLIGMTNLPEAKLAREAEIAYATLALITDYDCWHDDTPHVDFAMILETLHKNAQLAKEVIKELVLPLQNTTPSELASEALKFSIVTKSKLISKETKEKLRPIIGRYIKD